MYTTVFLNQSEVTFPFCKNCNNTPFAESLRFEGETGESQPTCTEYPRHQRTPTVSHWSLKRLNGLSRLNKDWYESACYLNLCKTETLLRFDTDTHRGVFLKQLLRDTPYVCVCACICILLPHTHYNRRHRRYHHQVWNFKYNFKLRVKS